MKLLSNNKETLTILYKKLGEANVLQQLRNFYEENSTDRFCDQVFTRMMLLDACFVLYYILFIFEQKVENCPDLRSHQIVFVHQDLFLLENQIPFKVLNEVMDLVNINWNQKLKSFIDDNILASARPKRRWFCVGDQSCRDDSKGDHFNVEADHLLHLLHRSLTQINGGVPSSDMQQTRCTFRNVNELIDVGIRFKPSSTMSLAHIEFYGRWWGFSADIKLPPITVDDSTKPMFLNLIAYEMCSDKAHAAWVTSYICLLDSLIDHSVDVKALRKAGVLDNNLGSDEEVAKLFNQISTDLVPNNLAYWKAKIQIQKHYDSLRNTRLSQLKHEYVKSPWSFLALVGAVLALVLSGVQSYYTVWSPKGECDDLCMFLKMNHHL